MKTSLTFFIQYFVCLIFTFQTTMTYAQAPRDNVANPRATAAPLIGNPDYAPGGSKYKGNANSYYQSVNPNIQKAAATGEFKQSRGKTKGVGTFETAGKYMGYIVLLAGAIMAANMAFSCVSPEPWGGWKPPSVLLFIAGMSVFLVGELAGMAAYKEASNLVMEVNHNTDNYTDQAEALAKAKKMTEKAADATLIKYGIQQGAAAVLALAMLMSGIEYFTRESKIAAGKKAFDETAKAHAVCKEVYDYTINNKFPAPSLADQPVRWIDYFSEEYLRREFRRRTQEVERLTLLAENCNRRCTAAKESIDACIKNFDDEKAGYYCRGDKEFAEKITGFFGNVQTDLESSKTGNLSDSSFASIALIEKLVENSKQEGSKLPDFGQTFCQITYKKIHGALGINSDVSLSADQRRRQQALNITDATPTPNPTGTPANSNDGVNGISSSTQQPFQVPLAAEPVGGLYNTIFCGKYASEGYRKKYNKEENRVDPGKARESIQGDRTSRVDEFLPALKEYAKKNGVDFNKYLAHGGQFRLSPNKDKKDHVGIVKNLISLFVSDAHAKRDFIGSLVGVGGIAAGGLLTMSETMGSFMNTLSTPGFRFIWFTGFLALTQTVAMSTYATYKRLKENAKKYEKLEEYVRSLQEGLDAIDGRPLIQPQSAEVSAALAEVRAKNGGKLPGPKQCLSQAEGKTVIVDCDQCIRTNTCDGIATQEDMVSLFGGNGNAELGDGDKRDLATLVQSSQKGDVLKASQVGNAFGKKIPKIKEEAKKLISNINAQRQANGQAPLDFEKEGAKLVSSVAKKLNNKGIKGGLGLSAPSVGGDKKEASNGSEDTQVLEGGGTMISAAGKEKRAQTDYFGSYGDANETPALDVGGDENLDNVMAKNFDYTNDQNQISDKPDTSIFKILSYRYFKSGYSNLFEERKPSSDSGQ